jgi:hypothetical protein
MFGHFTYILPQHHVALESAIRSHSVVSSVNAVLLARMYKLAMDGLKQPIQETGYFTSSLRAGNITLSSVTETKSGLWLQLAKVENQAHPYLTLGQKWAQENYSPALGNTSTVFWQ